MGVGRVFRFVRVLDGDADRGGLADGLRGDGKRRDEEDAPAGVLRDLVRPCGLHARLPEPSVGEDARAAAVERPLDDACLPVEEVLLGVELVDGEPGVVRVDALRCEVVGVRHRAAPHAGRWS